MYIWFLILCYLNCVSCFRFDFQSWASEVNSVLTELKTTAKQVQNYASEVIKNNVDFEFCNSGSIPYNISGLERDLRDNVFGQPIVNHLVTNSLWGHARHSKNKALALSFHGWVGCGKNYVTSFITKNLFLSGAMSKFVRMYNGRNQFPYASKVAEYRVQLKDDILSLVKSCSKALFIFDEVDKMPEGVLDVILPFLDNNERVENVDFREAVFIFISNSAGKQIAQRTLELLKKGKTRNELASRDFEDILLKNAFIESGGLRMSDIISHHLIDHFVPFLPLEKQHVIMCIQAEITNYFSGAHKRNIAQHPAIIKEVLADVLFDPELDEMFSNSGCKRLSQKVAVALGNTSWDYEEQRLAIDEL